VLPDLGGVLEESERRGGEGAVGRKCETTQRVLDPVYVALVPVAAEQCGNAQAWSR
jgi:hypothetical protein